MREQTQADLIRHMNSLCSIDVLESYLSRFTGPAWIIVQPNRPNILYYTHSVKCLASSVEPMSTLIVPPKANYHDNCMTWPILEDLFQFFTHLSSYVASWTSMDFGNSGECAKCRVFFLLFCSNLALFHKVILLRLLKDNIMLEKSNNDTASTTSSRLSLLIGLIIADIIWSLVTWLLLK